MKPVGDLAILLSVAAVAGLLLAEPGVEHQDNGDNEFLFRVGVGWEFEPGEHFVITPIANMDYVDVEGVYVYGLKFGYRFGGC